MERSEKQERSDIIYIELDGESTGAEGWRDPLGRKETENGRGNRVAGGEGATEESRRCGGSGWMQEDCARRVRKREGGYCRRRRRRWWLRSNGDVSVHADAESASALA